ncbi:hypothetical protein D9M73_190950 [compost metagenome]
MGQGAGNTGTEHVVLLVQVVLQAGIAAVGIGIGVASDSTDALIELGDVHRVGILHPCRNTGDLTFVAGVAYGHGVRSIGDRVCTHGH